MSRRYDSRTTIFSPDGKLLQVQYAMEAISYAGTVVGILTKEGIVIGAEKKALSKLLESSEASEKIYLLNDNLICGVAGLTSDANILVNFCRNVAQGYLLTYNSEVPIEHLVKRVCNMKQGYTQNGGLRPFGASILYGGYDPHYGFQLYQSDPSGNYSGWKAYCIGANSGSAQSILKQEFNEELTLEQAKDLAIKVLSKTMDTTTLTSEKLEFATLKLKDGKPIHQIYNSKEIEELLKQHAEAAQAASIEQE